MTKTLNLTNLSELKKQLNQIPIDTDEIYYKLSRLEFLNLLNELLSWIMPERDVENIVELIECRDWIEFESEGIKESIHLIANHTINWDSLQEVIQKVMKEYSH